MEDKKPNILSTPNPVHEVNNNKVQRLSRWFVSHQKQEGWDEKKLNILHMCIATFLVVAYVCHVIGSPYIRFVEDPSFLVIISIIECIFLVAGVFSFLKMCLVNGSWTATKLIFDKKNIRTYVYLFWLLRSFIVEILKGQVLYSFVAGFHSIAIYASDTWYLCNRRVLICNLLIYLVMLVYEFLVSISPVGPTEPSWKFMNIETTANSLSRSNYFNLFVIFFDAIIVVLNDLDRSKYVMLVKKQKRNITEVSASDERRLKRIWIAVGLITFAAGIFFVVARTFTFPRELENIFLGCFLGVDLILYFVILYHSSTSRSIRTIWSLLQERRVVFILILLGLLFFVDNVYLGWSAAGILYPLLIIGLISYDLIVIYFPRRISLVTLFAIVTSLLWNIFNYNFVKSDCSQNMLKWGVFGEEISYCTVKRLIYQSILSLLCSAAINILRDRTSALFFCNANILRSAGTITRGRRDIQYVRSMELEKKSHNSNS